MSDYLEHYEIKGRYSYAIDTQGGVWFGGCKILGDTRRTVQQARALIYSDLKNRLISSIAKLETELREMKNLNHTMTEPFELRMYRIKRS